jgi:hypothetical protein
MFDLAGSNNVVPGKEAWFVVLAFVFVAGDDQSRHVPEEISPLNRNTFASLSEDSDFRRLQS